MYAVWLLLGFRMQNASPASRDRTQKRQCELESKVLKGRNYIRVYVGEYSRGY